MGVGRVNLEVFLVVTAVALLLHGAAAAEYTVGDTFGWAVPTNNDRDFYQKWTSNKTFHAGDSFLFNWTGNHTVTARTKEQYDSCDKAGGIDVVSSGFRLTLEKNGTYYYICKVDNHCEQGQKIAVVIGNGVNDEEDDKNDSGSAPSVLVGTYFKASISALIVYSMNYYY